MKKIPFSTPIWCFKLNLDFQKESEKCFDIKKKFNSLKKSNVNGYHGPLESEINFNEIFPDVHFQMMKEMGEVTSDVNEKIKFSDYWININKKHSYNLPHTHPSCFLSCVLYLKTSENCGNIVFKNPTLSLHYPMNDKNENFFATYWFKPFDGLMLVFPSYLEHYVEPNQDEVERISMAINFKLDNA